MTAAFEGGATHDIMNNIATLLYTYVTIEGSNHASFTLSILKTWPQEFVTIMAKVNYKVYS